MSNYKERLLLWSCRFNQSKGDDKALCRFKIGEIQGDIIKDRFLRGSYLDICLDLSPNMSRRSYRDCREVHSLIMDVTEALDITLDKLLEKVSLSKLQIKQKKVRRLIRELPQKQQSV